MNTSEKDLILTLDNGKKYTLVNTIIKDSIQYVCLTNIDNYGDMIFGKLNGNEISVIKDTNLLLELIQEFDALNKNS